MGELTLRDSSAWISLRQARTEIRAGLRVLSAQWPQANRDKGQPLVFFYLACRVVDNLQFRIVCLGDSYLTPNILKFSISFLLYRHLSHAHRQPLSHYNGRANCSTARP